MNDWLDYKGSGSSRAYMGDYTGATIGHAFFSREKIDDGVKAVGDVITLPFKTGELGRQLKAYADLISAKRERYDQLVDKANKCAADAKNLFKLADRDKNKRQYEQYKREAEKIASDINKIKNDANEDISKYQQHVRNNEILGPIIRAIEDSAKSLPAVMSMTFDSAMTNRR